jgi:hypothetical protein
MTALTALTSSPGELMSADSEMQLIAVGGNSPFKQELDADLAMGRTDRLARETEA